MVERDKLSVSGWREILPNVYEREGDHKEEDSRKWNERPIDHLRSVLGSLRFPPDGIDFP